MRRRGVGVGAIKKKQASKEKYAQLADKLEATQEAHVEEVLASFKAALESFASKHRRKIRSDPVFRSRFTSMCYDVGVDPLRSGKGFFAEALGVGSYFFELGVKVVEKCAATRDLNGGLMTLDELIGQLGGAATKDDLRRAIAKLDVLGDGFRLVDDLVFSVPVELNDDHTRALDLARHHRGQVHVDDLQRRLLSGGEKDNKKEGAGPPPNGGAPPNGQQQQQPRYRAATVLAQLADDGFAWIDQPTPHREPPVYYFPSIWLEARASSDDDADGASSFPSSEEDGH